LTKWYIEITGIADDEGLSPEDLRKDLRIKAEVLKLENLQVYNSGQVKEK
jgi:hypothetical protein